MQSKQTDSVMVDLSSEMAALAERLGPAPGAIARVVQFVAAEQGEGTSTIAREFAREVSRHASRGVWLIELDLMKGEQYATLAAEPETYGRLSEPVRATPGSEMFFSVTPQRVEQNRSYQDANYLAAHQVGGARWWVGRFRRELLVGGQSVRILAAPDYWDLMRSHADYVIVDAPSWARSRAAAAVAPFMDANLILVSADQRNVRATASLRDGIEAAGGVCGGLVVNRAPKSPPAFLRALLP